MIRHYKPTESFTVKVIKPFFFDMKPTKIGEVITVPGNLYIDLINRNCVVDYKQLSDAESDEIIANMEVELPADQQEEPKKLGPKKRKSKK